MSSTLSPSTADHQRPGDLAPNSSSPFTYHMTATPAEGSLLSPYSTFPPYSISPSPSNFSTSAELTSETGGYSEFSDYNGEDEFFGIDFDAGEQELSASPGISDETPLPDAQATTDPACLLEKQPDKTQDSIFSTELNCPLGLQPALSSGTNQPVANEKSSLGAPAEPSGTICDLTSGQTTLDIPSSSQKRHFPLDMKGSDKTTLEATALGSGPFIGHSPRVTLTTWGSTEQHEISPISEQMGIGGETTSLVPDNTEYFSDGHFRESAVINPYHLATAQNSDNISNDDEAVGRKGVDPDRRKSFSAVEIPSLKDMVERDRIDLKNRDVEEWRSQAAESTDSDDDTPFTSHINLAAPVISRRRAKSASAVATDHSNSLHGYRIGNLQQKPTPQHLEDPEEGEGIDPVSDSESIRENRLVEGQIYYNTKANEVNEEDFEMMQLSRHWYDGPSYPDIIKPSSNMPTATAQEQIKKWNNAADSFSLLSRSATWGTRRRSEPSVADIESIRGVGMLKRVSFGRTPKEKKPGIFKEITNIVLKKADGTKLKRSRSDREGSRPPESVSGGRKESASSLAPPVVSASASRTRPASPRVNTNFPNHSRQPSVSASSPKNAFGFVGKAIRRARSNSHILDDTPQVGLAALWREHGGPPLPTLASPPVDNEEFRPAEDIKLTDLSDIDGDGDDEEDDTGDDVDRMEFSTTTPIVPTIEGFRDHLLHLNPTMELSYLTERIAHQQLVRYKSLLSWRVKHSGLIQNGSCNAGHHCIAQGGSPTHPDKIKARSHRSSNSGNYLMGEESDEDVNPEGQLSPESFPPGVPMPPTQSLPAEFECQLCFRVKKFLKPSDWTKHVHEDVQPFTCTYSNCRESKSFKRKADWVRHENERHRHLEWWTCQVDDCNHRCYRKDNFLQHLVREHKLPEPKEKTKAAIKKAKGSEERIWVTIRSCHHETSARPQDEPCKFCGAVLTSWKKLTVHLSKHMEHISLPLLRLVEQQQVNADTIISPVEALPVQPEPNSAGDMKRHASGSSAHRSQSASVTPNMQSYPQFHSPNYNGSLNAAASPQFPDALYSNAMMYSAPSNDVVDYNEHAPISQPQLVPESMYRGGGVSFNNTDYRGTQIGNTHSENFHSPLNHSPISNQSHGFTTINRGYPNLPPQNYPFLSVSNTMVSPNTSSFVTASTQPSSFQTQSRNTEPTVFDSISQQLPDFSSSGLLAINDQVEYTYQSMTPSNLGLGFHHSQIQMQRNQNNSRNGFSSGSQQDTDYTAIKQASGKPGANSKGYQPTSQGNYAFQG